MTAASSEAAPSLEFAALRDAAADTEPAERAETAMPKPEASWIAAIPFLVLPSVEPPPLPATPAPQVTSAMVQLRAQVTGAALATERDRMTPQQVLPDLAAVQMGLPPNVATRCDAPSPAGPHAAAMPTRTLPVPPDAVPLTIARHAGDGITSFSIRLDPAELGRVDVRLAIDDAGAVRTYIIVERPDTLHMLRGDASRLDQALTEAGLRADTLTFSMGDGHTPHHPQQPGGPNTDPGADDSQQLPTPHLTRLAYPSAAARLDLVV